MYKYIFREIEYIIKKCIRLTFSNTNTLRYYSSSVLIH